MVKLVLLLAVLGWCLGVRADGPFANVKASSTQDTGNGPYIGAGCASRPPAQRPDCCAQKTSFDIYDPICDINPDCASWPPAHQMKCCKDKVTASTYSTDTVCMIILGCASWSQGSKDWTSCCDRKAAAGVHDEGCPDDWPGDACGAKDGDAKNGCCSSKANKGIYDPGCDMGEKCSTWPPQHRKECCDAKAAKKMSDGACNISTSTDCSKVDGDNLLYCCIVKDDAHVWDAACSSAGFCSSDFFSLPKVANNNKMYFLGYSDSTAASLAGSFCKTNGYTGAGTTVKVTLPDGRASQADQWRTYNEEAKDKVCQGAACVAYGVIECVKANAKPLGKSWGENIGCYNSGMYNIGNGNSGSGNHGNGNSGSVNVGDGNSGANNIGDGNSLSEFFGTRNQPYRI